MSACNDRYRRGVEILQQVSGSGVEDPINRVAEIAPDFARMAIEFAYGDLYSRNALDLRTRELIAVACLATLGHSPQLEHHAGAALHLGCSPSEVVEAIMQSVIYAGFPSALDALAACHDLLAGGAPTSRRTNPACSASAVPRRPQTSEKFARRQAAARGTGQG